MGFLQKDEKLEASMELSVMPGTYIYICSNVKTSTQTSYYKERKDKKDHITSQQKLQRIFCNT